MDQPSWDQIDSTTGRVCSLPRLDPLCSICPLNLPRVTLSIVLGISQNTARYAPPQKRANSWDKKRLKLRRKLRCHGLKFSSELLAMPLTAWEIINKCSIITVLCINIMEKWKDSHGEDICELYTWEGLDFQTIWKT